MPYLAPVADIEFLFEHVVNFAQLRDTERFSDATEDVTRAILNEAGKLSEEVLAPLQRAGDMHPARLENGVVRTSPGFAGGWRAIADGGWIGISADPAHGGMGLPMTLASAVNDMMSGACLSLQLAPLMSQGQIEALEHHGSDTIRRLYLPKLISGEWTGTMNLTEPHAGSDVGALTSQAKNNGDGTFSITGQKAYISWGDHDVAENVCHLVLARMPGAPSGTKGISLFIVPKYLPDESGNCGATNALKVVSLEHKLGLHGSPTAVMQYDGATGWLVGQEQGGMAAMFTMMNNARLGVGLQGIGVAEAACQQALDYASERKQGVSRRNGARGSISDHADVRRMLITMKAEVFAARGIALSCAMAIDMASATDDPEWAARAALLTPVNKLFGTETGIGVSDMALQVHGGMGFIEETGAAQFCRDVRVTGIYEGTNGIQAMDLTGRKMMDGGEAAFRLLDEVAACAAQARLTLPVMGEAVWQACETLREATEWLVNQQDMDHRFAGAVPYTRAFARVLGAYIHLQAAMAGRGSAREKIADFYISRLLPEHAGLLAHAQAGAEAIYEINDEELLSQ